MSAASGVRKLAGAVRWYGRTRSRRMHRLVAIEPCYFVSDRLKPGDIVIDAGLGDSADFSVALIRRYGVVSLGFDPTPKHTERLRRVEEELGGSFRFHPAAVVGGTATRIRFFQSDENVSGSVDSRHVNVAKDRITAAWTDAVQLGKVVEGLDEPPQLVKLDIEGSEYEVLDSVTDAQIMAVQQWIVEFHHDTVEGITFSATRRQLRRFEGLGFDSFSRDLVNFTFARRIGQSTGPWSGRSAPS